MSKKKRLSDRRYNTRNSFLWGEDWEEYVDGSKAMNKFAAYTDGNGRLRHSTRIPLAGLGYFEDNLFHKPFWEARWFRQSEESQKKLREGIQEASSGHVVSCSVNAYTRTGNPVPVVFTISPLNGPDSDIISIVGDSYSQTQIGEPHTQPKINDTLDLRMPTLEYRQPEQTREKRQISQPPSDSTYKQDPHSADLENPRFLLESMTDLVWTTDLSYRNRYVNPVVVHMLGYTPEEYRSLPIQKIMPQKSLNAIKSALDQVHSSSEKRSSLLIIEYLHRDGTIIPAELAICFINDSKGNAVGILGISREVTKRSDIEEDIQYQGERFKALLRNSSEVICILDEEGTIVYESPSVKRLLDITPEDVIGIPILNLIHPDDIPKATSFLAKMTENPGTTVYEQLRRQFGDNGNPWHWLEISGINLLGEPQVEGMVLYYRDISHNKERDSQVSQYQQQLQEALDQAQLSLREVSTPVVQAWDGILMLPLIGVIDDYRAKLITEDVLSRIADTKATMIIIDVTGVVLMDSRVANHIIRMVNSVALLGTKCIVTGITPIVAQTMIRLGLDLSEITTQRDMQEGLKLALKQTGHVFRDSHHR
ncbi:MAG: PAS domain S-box protein [Chloroflexota bacterium]|nr:PAS domain S-box protein [Chloroflexota bacterium]